MEQCCKASGTIGKVAARLPQEPSPLRRMGSRATTSKSQQISGSGGCGRRGSGSIKRGDWGKQWLEVLSLVLPGNDERSVWWPVVDDWERKMCGGQACVGTKKRCAGLGRWGKQWVLSVRGRKQMGKEDRGVVC